MTGGAEAVVSRVESLATRQRTPCGAGSMVWRAWGDGRPLVLLHGTSGSWPASRSEASSEASWRRGWDGAFGP